MNNANTARILDAREAKVRFGGHFDFRIVRGERTPFVEFFIRPESDRTNRYLMVIDHRGAVLTEALRLKECDSDARLNRNYREKALLAAVNTPAYVQVKEKKTSEGKPYPYVVLTSFSGRGNPYASLGIYMVPGDEASIEAIASQKGALWYWSSQGVAARAIAALTTDLRSVTVYWRDEGVAKWLRLGCEATHSTVGNQPTLVAPEPQIVAKSNRRNGHSADPVPDEEPPRRKKGANLRRKQRRERTDEEEFEASYVR